ncbi:uncharacterized protein [Setaria viridis]|uniref:uncharacterized protein n=1 Tax=Setaria viridis TaxID=4556 RepID=UPI003B3BD05F
MKESDQLATSFNTPYGSYCYVTMLFRLRNVGATYQQCMVPKGKLLGYIISERSIEGNPEKISAISNMGPIRNVKGVQRLTGCLAALSYFISRLGVKGVPLYKLLKK